jgi:type 2 lantibiotic biosynthesis protein LanM
MNKQDFNAAFYDYLLNQILSNSIKTILTLFFAFKKENLLEGNSSEERYDYFDKYSATKEFHDLVNKIYPLLKLKLDGIIHNHIVNYNDLKMRAISDKEEIYNKFGFNIEDIRNCHIRYGLSDYHRGLKSTCIIENRNRKIVYKPRSGAIDEYWGIFIDWFNSKDPSPKLDTIKVIDKGEYHWQEYVGSKPCNSESEIRKLYYRIGLLAAISYVLKMEDLHMENMIVNGEFPYIVDLETIFQIDGFQNGNLKVKSATDILNKKIRQSILSTQLFPVPGRFHDSNIDISGITGKGGQVIKNGKTKIINQFTDEIEIIREDGMTEGKDNIGRIENVLINPKDYIEEIVEGFREGYILLESNKEELLQLINSGELFYNIYPRYLFRNTNLYATILEMGKNPKYFKNRSELDRLYHLLFKAGNNHKFKKIYQSELSDLFNDDIPYFYGCINDKVIYNTKGEGCFELERTPLTEVIERINNLNKKDMDIQVDLILKSMARQKKTWNIIRERIDDNLKNIDDDNSLMEAAKEIGDMLINKATIHEKTGTISWLDLQNTYPTWTIRAQDVSLYNGLAGNAIFFFSLYLATNDIKYHDILQKILNTIKIDSDRINNKYISAFNGSISLAYLYAFLYNQTKDRGMLKQSLDIISQYKDMILDNISYDIIDGLSGVLIVILNIYELSKDKELEELSIGIGQDIIKNIQIGKDAAYWKKGGDNELMIAGFSHGLSGVTYALSRLYKLTDYKENISIIDNLIQIENNYYNDDIENWIDLRREDNSNLDETPIHWCHGAVGIGLSRLRCKEIIDTSSDIDKALEVVRKKGLYRDSDCLCHGNLGNIELLLEVYKENGDLNLYNEAINRAKEIIRESKWRKEGYKNGIGQEFDSPGLMLGLSGIGYEMLRLLNPTKYPSILLLEV